LVTELSIVAHLQRLRRSIGKLGGNVDLFTIEPPTTMDNVEAVERAIGRLMPAPLRSFFTEVAAGVDLLWTVETVDGGEFMGQFDLRLADISLAWTNWTGWRDSFAHPEEHGWPPEMNLRVYEAMFPLLSVMNGDQVVLFYDDPDDPGEVMYLSHEHGEGDRTILATSYARFLQTWVPLACPGPDFEDLVDFYDFDAQELSLDIEEARKWVDYLNSVATEA
jgi:hypothetical protein